MRKIIKFGLVIMVAAMAWGGYLLSQLSIFEQVQIQFQHNQSTHYQPTQAHLPLSCYEAQTPVAPLVNKTFKLVSWNIHKGQDEGWRQDLARLSENADFVLLQEATPAQQLKTFENNLFASAFAYKNQASGIKSFAKTAPQWYCVDSLAEPWIQIPKVAGVMAFPLANGESLLVVNLHLINFELKMTAYRQQLAQMFSLLALHQGPLIIAGDFNAWRGKRADLIGQFMRQHGLQEVALQEDKRVRFFSHPLDYIFTRGVKVVSATSEALNSSDHNPVVLEFTLEHLQ